MKRIFVYIALLFLGSSFLAFSWAMEEDKSIPILKIFSKPHTKKSNKKGVKRESFWKKKSSKKSILAAQIDAYLAKGRRKSYLEK